MKNPIRLAAVALTAATLSLSAFAQEPGSPGASNKPMARPGTSTTTPNPGVGGSGAFSGWLSDYQAQNKGKVSRQAYMDEVGRRWDSADTNRQGLTVDQINQTYGSGPVNATPGNMGPGNVKK